MTMIFPLGMEPTTEFDVPGPDLIFSEVAFTVAAPYAILLAEAKEPTHISMLARTRTTAIIFLKFFIVYPS